MSIQLRAAASRQFAVTRAKILRVMLACWEWTLERAPIFGRASIRRRRQVVLAPYARMHTLRGSLTNLVALPIIVFGCLFYGFFFGLTAPFLMVPFLVPIAACSVIIIWALPDQKSAPTAPIEFLFGAHFVILALWPKYLAITLPGLPWITLLRLAGLPMAGLFLVSLSVSKAFRTKALESVTSIKLLWIFVCGFATIQVITSFVSSSPIAAAQIVFDEQIYWTCIFILSSMIFRNINFVEKYFGLLCATSAILIAITYVEFKEEHVIWAEHIPGFLRIPDPSVQLTLSSIFRPGTHVYRAKAIFATPLVLAEYISLLTPFLLHFALSKGNIVVRLACAAMVPLTFFAVRMTDARLGVVGIVVSILLYGMLWTIVRWRSNPKDLLAAATVYAYPALFVAGLGAILSSHRAKMMMFGDEAQAGSTAARETQLAMALPKVWSHPWGYGGGQSGNAMGFAKGSFVTIDNYFISLILDYGIFGTIFWYGMFLTAIFYSIKYAMSPKYGHRPESKLLAPVAVSLIAFLIVKWVHGQSDNHSMFFMMLGMISALIYRIHNDAPAAGQAG